MRCFHPINIGGDEPFFVPCGKCLACQKRHSNEWCVRLQHELMYQKSAHFVTLTYNDEHLKFYNELTGEVTDMPSVSLRDIQLFFKRLRKSICKDFGEDYKIRYFLASEYGPTYHRPHYHAIIYNLPPKGATEYIDKAWQQGFVKVDPVTDQRIRYVTKYCFKKEECTPVSDNVMPVFTTMSRRPFLGSGFVFAKANMAKYHLRPENTAFLTLKGFKYGMPRTYVNVYCPKGSCERDERNYRIQLFSLNQIQMKLAKLAFLEENEPEEYRRQVMRECMEEDEANAKAWREKKRKERHPLRLKSIQVS